MKIAPSDYLKFWRVIRYYMKAKHGVSQADLDMILFLYSESYFGKDKFDEFNELISWEVGRFERLRQEGWIERFRSRSRNGKALYQLSYKANNMVKDIYKKLNGEEIPVSLSYNPMFLKNVSYNDKVYRNMILKMNAYQRENKYRKPTPQPPHHAPE
jgi:hypothetical protein